MITTSPTLVHAKLIKHYPAKVLDWVKRAKWRHDPAVPLAKIDMTRRPGGRDPKKVAGIAAAVKAGKRLPPVALVDTGAEKYAIADGYHRTLGYAHAGRTTIPALIGSTTRKTGPWDKTMHRAKLNLSTVDLTATTQPAGYVEETMAIKERAKTATYPHKFTAAKWTHPNGHPRCRTCGQEERTGGTCTKPTDLSVVDLAGVCTGQGPCDTTPFGAGKNWVNKVGGLPLYIRAVAKAFQRQGHSESEAIQRAVGVVKNWAEGKGNVTVATRARAAAAIAEWDRKKAQAHAAERTTS